MLILSNEEIESLLTVDLALKALERAYIGRPKARRSIACEAISIFPACMRAACTPLRPWKGGLVESKVVALRLNSDTIRWEEREPGW